MSEQETPSAGYVAKAGLRGKPVRILLVEDSADDVDLTLEALAEAKVCNELYAVDNGLDAMALLRQEGKFTQTLTPDVILLDLNLPRMDGREVLAQIKADPKLRRIPVVILTTSAAEEDVLRAYDLHANCYITKPVDFEQFLQVVRSIEAFWLSIVALPPNHGGDLQPGSCQ